MENTNKFIVVNDKNEEIECEILFTFNSEETGKDYMVYTDNTEDDEGNVRVYASCYKEHDDKTDLIPIKTDREWKIIETILDSIQEENNKK